MSSSPVVFTRRSPSLHVGLATRTIVLQLVESPGSEYLFLSRKRGFVKKPIVTVLGRPGIAMAAALVVGLIAVPVGAAAASGTGAPSVSVLVPPAAAKKAGFTKVVNAPTASTSTGVTGCADGTEEEFSDAAGKIGLVSEVLYCSGKSAAVGLLKNVASADKPPAGLKPPKGLGSTAIERVGSDSSYLIVWRRGTAFELVGLSPDLAAGSTTSTTAAAPVPLTSQEQTQLSQAATQQNAQFKAFSAPSSPPAAGSAANAKAQAKANAVSVAAGCPKSPATALKKSTWSSAPAMAIDTTKSYTATVKTDLGSFTIALDAKNDPKTVNNFVFLAQHGFYNCVIFHRVIPQFMDQTGDPTGTGSGGPGYTIPDELPATASSAADEYPLGSVAMANTGQPNTGGSQWFIVAGPEGESLPASYSLFGHVTSGMKVVDKINAQGSAAGVPPDVTHRMLKVTISS